MLRRVNGARIKDPHTVEDLVQEAGARDRIQPDKLAQYASLTARNLVRTLAEQRDRQRDRVHLLVDPDDGETPDVDVLREEERAIVGEALAHLPAGDRDFLLAHEVEG